MWIIKALDRISESERLQNQALLAFHVQGDLRLLLLCQRSHQSWLSHLQSHQTERQ